MSSGLLAVGFDEGDIGAVAGAARGWDGIAACLFWGGHFTVVGDSCTQGVKSELDPAIQVDFVVDVGCASGAKLSARKPVAGRDRSLSSVADLHMLGGSLRFTSGIGICELRSERSCSPENTGVVGTG